jgi:hypothetical protein
LSLTVCCSMTSNLHRRNMRGSCRMQSPDRQ